MATYKAFNKTTGEEVKSGDKVTDHRGWERTFSHVSRPAMPGKDAKVIVDGCEYYAEVFDLRVEEVP